MSENFSQPYLFVHFRIDYVLTKRLCGYVMNLCFSAKHLCLHNTHIKDTMLKSYDVKFKYILLGGTERIHELYI